MIAYEPNLIPMIALTSVAFLAVYAIKAVVMIIPAPALYIAAGVAFPIGWALIITYLGLIISLSVGYFNGKKLGEKRATELISKNRKVADFLESKLDRLSYLCFISRILPFPKDLFSMLYGAIGMPFYKYIAISLMGMSPIMIPNVLVGHSIGTPISPEFLIPFGISLAVALVVFILYKGQTANKPA